jgi:hypothetical protein
VHPSGPPARRLWFRPHDDDTHGLKRLSRSEHGASDAGCRGRGSYARWVSFRTTRKDKWHAKGSGCCAYIGTSVRRSDEPLLVCLNVYWYRTCTTRTFPVSGLACSHLPVSNGLR